MYLESLVHALSPCQSIIEKFPINPNILVINFTIIPWYFFCSFSTVFLCIISTCLCLKCHRNAMDIRQQNRGNENERVILNQSGIIGDGLWLGPWSNNKLCFDISWMKLKYFKIQCSSVIFYGMDQS